MTTRCGLKRVVFPLIATAIAICPIVAGLEDGSRIAGKWVGKLETPGGFLTVVFNIEKKDDGSLSSTLDSPDQGATGIPVDTTTFEGDALTLELERLGAGFTGKLEADGKLVGEWKQSGLTIPVTLEKDGKIPERRRPQEPQPPFPYVEREVTYENPAAGITLAGTLTLPPGKGPFPAVLLITGSGPQDRNEALLGHKPFLVLSDHLTRHGIAVLRSDDRGVGESTGDFGAATSLDFASDAEAGVAYLQTVDEVDPGHIGLVGHSEGGLIAPIVASRSSAVSFIVLLAGTGVNGEQILYEQTALIAQANGASEESIQKVRKVQKQLFAAIQDQKDDAKARAQINGIIEELDEEERTMLGGTDAVRRMLSPWFRTFLQLEPTAYLEKVSCPVLALNGEKDLQVPPQQNLPAIERALARGGNSAVTVQTFTGHNHLFQRCTTGSPIEYAKIEETMSPVVLESISTWIQRIVKAERKTESR